MALIAGLTGQATVLVCGASRGIGLALCEQLLARDDVHRLFAVARQATGSEGLRSLALQYPSRIRLLDCDARDEWALAALASTVGAERPHLHLVLCTLGVLDEGPARAEKSLAQLDMASLQATFASNSFAPILLLKHLMPLLRRQPTTFAALSARVGSIGDNRLGGWYSYRASKAALNQLLRTASIELRRLNAQATVLALHPGTTDTQLSRPYQANVPNDKLFDTTFTAERLLALIARHGPADSGSFLAWDDQPIPW
ncbi:SDR family NAD(P)-dependent oxidoreductase [Pseudomonas sp. S75]|uniref:SDR family NAD(P)-dependent oxidoreductase n=1 Tax=unclassified Pseudomonas TaxID=196821 RepID=UPI0019034B07|nr:MULTISPECIES: SDR family NAD(P)-dependent oxidoreductase [unclassified Pseudomonas]MBJ9975009.1 SDR family NAD(P)-dependent oxidoreductase [Pseudomonas sp. S30]MBK0152846.1 SDR family NAD(P)-dependent oxidoreductase [Pseudomonas sp. S75]